MKIVKLKKELWKEQQATRKSELKTLAAELKTLKPQFKQSQRDVNACIKAYNIIHQQSHDGIKYGQSSVVYNEYIVALKAMWHLQYTLVKLQREYRCKHIIYSLYKGTPMEKIEPVMGTIEGRALHNFNFQVETHTHKDEIEQAIRDQKEFAETREKWLNLRRIAV